MSEEKLIGHMMNELAEAGIQMSFYAANNFGDAGGKISGAFSDEEKTLEVSTDVENWLHVFAHEYCHFKQWQEGLFDDVEQIAAYATFTSWLDGSRELPPKMLTGFIRKMQWLEMENEQRTINLLKKFEVDFDEAEYIRGANIDILSYEFCRRIRKWNTATLNVPEMAELMRSDRLVTEKEFGTLPEGFEMIAVRCYDFREENKDFDDD